MKLFLLLVILAIQTNLCLAGDPYKIGKLPSDLSTLEGPFLRGGNCDYVRVVTLENGRKAVLAQRNFFDAASKQDALETLRTVQAFSDEKIFAKVFKTQVTGQGNRGSIYILMEDMTASRSGVPMKFSGDGRDLWKFRRFSEEFRRDLSNKFQMGTTLHPDGHPGNVFVRAVEVEEGARGAYRGPGGRYYRLDVKLVDPFSEMRSFDRQVRVLTTSPAGEGVYAQYTGQWINRYVQTELNLPLQPHPDSWKIVADGYGRAAEAAAAHPMPKTPFHPDQGLVGEVKPGDFLKRGAVGAETTFESEYTGLMRGLSFEALGYGLDVALIGVVAMDIAIRDTEENSPESINPDAQAFWHVVVRDNLELQPGRSLCAPDARGAQRTLDTAAEARVQDLGTWGNRMSSSPNPDTRAVGDRYQKAAAESAEAYRAMTKGGFNPASATGK